MDKRIVQAAQIAGQKLGLSPRFLAAWFIAENGWEYPSNFNVGNISYSGHGIPPTSGVFEGVSHVQDNHVVVYKTFMDGVNAFCLLLSTPKADKILTVDLSDLHACHGDIEKMAEAVGRSNWAGSHYDPNDIGKPGILIEEVYQSSKLVEAFPEENAAPKPAPTLHDVKPVEPVKHAATDSGHQVITIQHGQTLGKIALDHHVPLRALQHLNDIKNPNHIEAGDDLKIPKVLKVKSGDTVWGIAKKVGSSVEKIVHMNVINPDKIYPGNHLYY